jgi:hypothetical protein
MIRRGDGMHGAGGYGGKKSTKIFPITCGLKRP